MTFDRISSDGGLGTDPISPINGPAVYNTLLNLMRAQAGTMLALQDLVINLKEGVPKGEDLDRASHMLDDARRQLEVGLTELEILERTLR